MGKKHPINPILRGQMRGILLEAARGTFQVIWMAAACVEREPFLNQGVPLGAIVVGGLGEVPFVLGWNWSAYVQENARQDLTSTKLSKGNLPYWASSWSGAVAMLMGKTGENLFEVVARAARVE
jgi:hypothetical protein